MLRCEERRVSERKSLDRKALGIRGIFFQHLLSDGGFYVCFFKQRYKEIASLVNKAKSSRLAIETESLSRER